MGTVGLSFGSATSGAGFDVSATVAQIVSNLQNVEKPWKTQLASLQKQDAAISSLGTLLSKVSSDLSLLTNLTGIMEQKTGSSSDSSVVSLTSATASAQAGTHTVAVKNLAITASGYLDKITNTADILSGYIVLQVGSGTATTINLDSSNNTLSGLAKAINASGAGITANILTDSTGSRLSLVSGTSGQSGSISVTSKITDSTTSKDLGYNDSAFGADATVVVDGIELTSTSNTVSNLIPGLTFQILASSAKDTSGTYTPVQVIIGNDTADAYSAISAFVSDYNALASAIQTQQGNDASGNAEPLFGSPTLSLLQQQLISGLNTQNPNGYVDAISTSLDVTVSGSMVLKVGTGSAQTISVDSAHNTLSGYADTINAANIGVTATVVTKNGYQTLTLDAKTSAALTVTSSLTANADSALTFTDAGYKVATADTGTLGSIAASTDILSGTLTLQVGSGSAYTVTIDSSNNTLSTLAESINKLSIGMSATVNSDGTGLTFTSGTKGASGVITVTSGLNDDTAGTSVSYTDKGYTAETADTGKLAGLGTSTDILSGSLVLRVGTAAAKTFTMDSSSNTISGLAKSINDANIGVKATVSADGSITLESTTTGSAGALTVASHLLNLTTQSASALGYTNSSDISTLSGLGITISTNANGTLELDSSTLDSLLNSDFSSVVGFFQNANSWGKEFANILDYAGTSKSTAMLALSLSSNSSSESTLNANISREESMISAQQKRLYAQLTSANQILQAIPQQLSEVNMIYSAITGYGKSS